MFVEFARYPGSMSIKQSRPKKKSIQEELFSEDIEGKIRESENMSICQNVDKSDVDISGLYCTCISLEIQA